MVLKPRLELAERTRFLLALSLSTATAIGVAAPLAIRAMNADDTIDAANSPVAVQEDAPGGDDLGADSDRRLDIDDESQGGIGSRSPVKGIAPTSKSTDGAAAPNTDPAPAPSNGDAIITNTDEPAPTPTPSHAEPVPGDGTVTTVAAVPSSVGPTTVPVDPHKPTTTTVGTTKPSTSTTTVPPSTTTTTPGGSSTSSSVTTSTAAAPAPADGN